MRLRRYLEEIEQLRSGRVLIIAATVLDLDLLPIVHDRLREIGRAERLDVLLYCRGGRIGAARRIAMLLNGFTDHLAFLIPDRCESAGTILALSGREIVAGPAAVFTPVDPQLEAESPGARQPAAMGAEDVRLFGEMAERWFGVAADEAGAGALSILSANIFPTTLSAFYRATLEAESVCAELLALGSPEASPEARAATVSALLRGYHSHSFPLAPCDLGRLGLPVVAGPAVDAPAGEIARALRAGIGPRARKDEAEGWTDALVASCTGSTARRRLPGAPGATWEDGPTE